MKMNLHIFFNEIVQDAQKTDDNPNHSYQLIKPLFQYNLIIAYIAPKHSWTQSRKNIIFICSVKENMIFWNSSKLFSAIFSMTKLGYFM